MITVIMQVLNELKALPATVNALRQQPGEFEAIVVGGGSSDRTPEILSLYPWIKVISSNRGRAKHMNAGACVAPGEWLLFMHADTFEQLPGQALINNSSMSELWKEWFESAGVVPTGALTDIEGQGTSQVLETINAEEGIGLVDLSFVHAEIEEGRLALACDHVLAGDGGYFLTYPESMSERTSLQLFEGWILSQVDTG